MSLRVLGVDMSSAFRRYWSAFANQPNQEEEAFKKTLRLIGDLRQGHDRVALCLDESTDDAGNLFRGLSWRRYVEPQYKWTRSEQSGGYFNQLRLLVERLEADGCIAFCATEVNMSAFPRPNAEMPTTGYYLEGDDLCASLATWCTAHRFSLTLYSADKDVLQLVSDTSDVCVIRDPNENRLSDGRLVWKEADVSVRLEKVKQNKHDVWIGVPPRLVPDYLALAGDGSDNFDVFPGWEDPSPGPTLGPDNKPILDAQDQPIPIAGTRHPGIGGGTACRLLAQFPKGLLSIIDQLETDASVLGRHHAEVLRRGLPTPREAAQRGLMLATLLRRPGPDYDCLLAEPVYKKLETRKYNFMNTPPADQTPATAPAPTTQPLATGVAYKVKFDATANTAFAAAVAQDRDAYQGIVTGFQTWCVENNFDPDGPTRALAAEVKRRLDERAAPPDPPAVDPAIAKAEAEAEAALKAHRMAQLADQIALAVAEGVAAGLGPPSNAGPRFNGAKAELADWCKVNGFDEGTTTRALDAMFAQVKVRVAEERAKAPPAPPPPPHMVPPDSPWGQAQGPVSEALQAQQYGVGQSSGTTTITVPSESPRPAPLARPVSAALAGASLASTALAPKNLPDLMMWADMAYNSRLFQHLPSPEAIAMVALDAMERNIGLVTALRNSHVINGKVGYTTALIVSMIRNSGLCEYFRVVESTWEQATVEFRRVDDPKDAPPTRYTATIADAKKKGFLDDKGFPVWKKDQKSMLVAMAQREPARMYFQEVCSGAYTPDELPGGQRFDGDITGG